MSNNETESKSALFTSYIGLGLSGLFKEYEADQRWMKSWISDCTAGKNFTVSWSDRSVVFYNGDPGGYSRSSLRFIPEKGIFEARETKVINTNLLTERQLQQVCQSVYQESSPPFSADIGTVSSVILVLGGVVGIAVLSLKKRFNAFG